MKIFLPTVAFISVFLAAASIEDCGGACAGNDNWTLFWLLLLNGLFFAGWTVANLAKE